MLNIYVNEVLIPDEDVIGIAQTAEEKLDFNFENLIAAKFTVELNNRDKSKYDDTYPGSLLNNISWYNKSFRVYDTQLELITWEGRLKNIRRDETKKKITLESTNYIKNIIDSNCIIAAGSADNITPSEIIYSILTDVVGIPETAINQTSFDNAKATQIANQGYIIVNYTAEQSSKCGEVISEILRMTSSNLYTINNIIYYYQFTPYTGALNTLIDESSIVAASWTDEYNLDNIYNDYKYAYYASASLVNFAIPDSTPGFITLSKEKYGTKYFNVPNEDLSSTLPADFKILAKSLTSARYYGNLKLSSNHYAKKICKFNIKKDFASSIYLNKFIDVTFDNLVREPMRVLERKINKKDISITAEFLNFPYEAIERDKIKPNPVQLMAVKSFIDDKIELRWTISDDAGFDYYQIEFSTAPNDFTGTFSNQGYSPIIVESPVIKDGLCTYFLTGLSNTARYYFQIKVTDTGGNTSDASNMLVYDVNYEVESEIESVFYRTAGNLINEIYVVSANGTPPDTDEFITYGEENYGTSNFTYGAIYKSTILSNLEGFERVIIDVSPDVSYFDIQYRTYSDGVYGFWNNFNVVINNGTEMFEMINESRPTQIQIRVLIKNKNYYDSYSAYIYSVNEGV